MVLKSLKKKHETIGKKLIGHLSIDTEKIKFLLLKFLHSRSGIACQIDREYNEYINSQYDDHDESGANSKSLESSQMKNELSINHPRNNTRKKNFKDYMNVRKMDQFDQLKEFCSKSILVFLPKYIK